MATQRIDLATQTNWGDLPAAGAPTRSNKRMAALVTSSDGDQACTTTVAATPANDSHVWVLLNGQERSVGDSVKTACDCYFSNDGGTTARAIADVAAGDTLHWNGSVAGFELTAQDVIDLDYDEASVSGSGGSIASPSVTTGALEIWVRAVDGDDSNHGLDSDNPLATITAAAAKIPDFVKHKVIIHVGAHTGNGYLIPAFDQRVLNANIYVIGDGAGVGDGFNELKASTAAEAGSSNLVVVASGMSVDAYYGKTIEMLTGAAAGDRRTIRNNTTSQIYPIYAFSDSVSIGDTFRVIEPTIKMEEVSGYPTHHYKLLSAGNGVVSTDPGGPSVSESFGLYFVNVIFHVNALKILSSEIRFFGVELINNSQVNLANSMILCGYDHNEFNGVDAQANGPNTDLGAASITSWVGWGANFSGLVFLGDRVSIITGMMVVDGYAVIYQATFVMKRGRINGGLTVQDHGIATLVEYSEPLIHVEGNPCVLVREQGYLSMGGVIMSGAGDGLYVRDDGRAYVDTLTGPVDGIGHRTAHGGVIRWAWDATLSGALGDFSEDDGITIRSNSSLIQGVSFVDLATLSKIYRNNFP